MEDRLFHSARSSSQEATEMATNSGGPGFRAYDKASGETLWEVELEAGTSGPPVSYMYEGRQYIVVAIGDREHSPELVAFTLPE